LNQNPAAGNSGIATGDSGGPLFWVTPAGDLVVVAIHRAADVQRTSIEFAYRTDVPQTLDFIDLVVEMVEAGVFD
jgi:hypothetical protein